MFQLTPRRAVLAILGATAFAGAAQAQNVTLRFHQMLPPQATIPAKAIVPWAKKVEAESGGRIKVQLFHAMAMGGTPPQLFDQARDGVADITWTVLGYTPGRFNKAEVFELPFMSGQAEPASRAFHEYVEKNAADEFREVKLLAAHTHGPGLFHSKSAITGLESLRGMKVRGGSRIINNMLTKLGATPVGMPVPAVTEALSKGVIDGTTIPWEVTPALKVTELVKNHTTFAGATGLYTQTFAVSMNKGAYDKLPYTSRVLAGAASSRHCAPSRMRPVAGSALSQSRCQRRSAKGAPRPSWRSPPGQVMRAISPCRLSREARMAVMATAAAPATGRSDSAWVNLSR